jgi:protein-tyrosine phosphatase
MPGRLTASFPDRQMNAQFSNTLLRIVSLPASLTRGKLYLCSMPGRFEPLEIFLQKMAVAEVGNVICLVSDEEIARKSPDYLAAIQREEIPATLVRFEITDYGLPSNVEEFDRTLDLIRGKLDNGESVVIHCAAGKGRTGMASIRLLTRMGMLLEQAIETIRLAGSSPDTQAQRDFLQRPL